MNEENIKQLLAIKQNQLSSLLELTKAINNNFSKAALLKLFEFVLNGQLGVKNLAVFVREENWILEISQGNPEVASKIDPKRDLTKFEIIQDVTRYPDDLYDGFEIIMPVVHKKMPLAYVLIGGLKFSELESRDDTLKFIETIANFILVSLENKRLFKIQLQQERIGKEVELASEVQSMLIPSILPSNEFVSFGAFYKPHGSIGGDYYDVISIDDSSVAFCMCDVSGKGLSAGMIMANFQAQLRSLLNKYDSLEQLVDYLNFRLYEITKGERYITMFLGVYNFNNRKLRYVNSGHNPTLLHQNGEIQYLDKGSTILGAFDNLPAVVSGEIVLANDAMVLCYTDGLTELEDDLGEMYGLERLNAFLFKNHKNDVNTFVENLKQEMISFKGSKDYNDDVSVLVGRFL
ncbi:MAG: serine/threonine-protein phosphatase [Chitinophagales bacterium]|nr:serine/threonine-protein phosphatase [Chitinophagales bacterium]